MAREDSLTQRDLAPKTFVTLGNDIYSITFTVRPLLPDERGPQSWPRVANRVGQTHALISAKAWPGQRWECDLQHTTTWTFHPIITAETNGAQRPLSRVQHILDAAGVMWPAPGGERGAPGHFTKSEEPRFFEALKIAAHAAAKENDHINYTSLRRYGLAGSRTTVKKYVERWDYDLLRIETEAGRCTSRLNSCAFIWRRRAEFKKKRP